MDPFTATIIVIVIVVIAAGVLAMNVLRAIRSVRRAAGSEAARLVGKMAEELLSGETGTLPSDLMTSQQPRSISDMTSVYAPRLAKDFPDLNLKQLISSAENKLCAALFAIMQGSAEEAGVQSGIGNYPSVEDAYSADSDERAQLFLGATPDFAAHLILRLKYKGVSIHLRQKGKQNALRESKYINRGYILIRKPPVPVLLLFRQPLNICITSSKMGLWYRVARR